MIRLLALYTLRALITIDCHDDGCVVAAFLKASALIPWIGVRCLQNVVFGSEIEFWACTFIVGYALRHRAEAMAMYLSGLRIIALAFMHALGDPLTHRKDVTHVWRALMRGVFREFSQRN